MAAKSKSDNTYDNNNLDSPHSSAEYPKQEKAMTTQRKSSVEENLEEDEFIQSLCYGDDSKPTTITKRTHPWLAFLHLLISPKMGWRTIKNSKFKTDEYARTVFYPLLALMSACKFLNLLYYGNISLGTLLQQAIAAFVAGFAGYYLICLLARTFLPTIARIKIDSNFGHQYVMNILCTLSIAAIIAEIIPWMGMLLLVLPIYAAYILAKGVKYLRVPEEESTPTAILMTVLCLGIPVSIYYVMKLMMPPA